MGILSFKFFMEKRAILESDFEKKFVYNYLRVVNWEMVKNALIAYCSIKNTSLWGLKKCRTKNSFLQSEISKKLNAQKMVSKVV